MSRNTIVAKRYAKALFDLASEQNLVSDIDSQLESVVKALDNEPQFLRLLNSPDISLEGKLHALRAVVGDKVSAPLQHILELLVTRGRQGIIVALYEAYIKIVSDALGQSHATVYSYKELSETELQELADQFGAMTSQKIIPKQIVDPSLLGGVQVRIGDRLYDGSLSGKLDRLQKTFKF